MSFDYDVLVIGSGFGGSVSALRLTEKGYRVGVLESGRRWNPGDMPKTSWDARKTIWAPRLGMTGPQRISSLGKITVFSAVGVGGGSLIYGNTLYEPLDDFYTDKSWAHLTDWRAELAPYYDQAKRMLGANTNPRTTPADEVLLDLARDLGVADTYHPTEVGVFFGEPGKTVPDPYFGGVGPERTGCIGCSRCFADCPHGAKNTTNANYLYLAEKAGAEVHPMTTVTDLRPLPDGGYAVTTQRSGALLRKGTREFTAEQVVFSAAAIGTQELLHKLRDTGRLPNLSPRLGELSRSNSEAMVMARSRTRSDFAQGVAISSSIHPEPNTHFEACHHGKGYNSLHLMFGPMIDGGPQRALRFLRLIVTHPLAYLRSLNVRRASERSIFLLVMQSLDNSLTSYRKRGRLRTKQGIGEPNPTWIPLAHKATRMLAEKIDGDPLGTYFDVFNIPSTAHYIGGAPMGNNAAEGVIDPYHRVHGHPGLHVIDGTAVSANLGVNPSLTITAMSERALAMWPNKDGADPRPALGQPYRRVKPVAPKNPAVPAAAPGALRLPLIPVDR
ncbi:MAG: GMC family oxidoreductase [Sciscionella sp.]|nr:GMC family oxidoreductase [Sciscionella sp.]